MTVLAISAIGVLAFFVPHSVAAMSYDYRYMNGYNQGQSDRSNNYYDNSACSHHHNWQYCEGYNDGYNNVKLDFNNTNRQESGQTSTVQIHGNNNRVEVTQNDNQANQSPQDNTGSDNSGGNSY